MDTPLESSLELEEITDPSVIAKLRRSYFEDFGVWPPSGPGEVWEEDRRVA